VHCPYWYWKRKIGLTKTPVENMSKSEPTARGGPMRNIAYFFLIVFLITATIAVVAGAFFGYSAIRGVKSVSDPVSELVRQLVVEATPVILPNPVVIIEEINSLARLETASYAFQDILQIQRNEELLWGVFGESMLFVAYGDVIAGVDLAQMAPEDLQVVSPTKVVVRLPEAEILLSDLDNERSYVADRDIGLLSRGDPQLETRIRQEAEARMVESALENGILDMANEEAQAFMFSFLEQLGFQEIEFVQEVMPALTPFVQEVPKGFVLTPEPSVLTTPEP
jgi:hypothetical protein